MSLMLVFSFLTSTIVGLKVNYFFGESLIDLVVAFMLGSANLGDTPGWPIPADSPLMLWEVFDLKSSSLSIFFFMEYVDMESMMLDGSCWYLDISEFVW
jgi:hypothetical protein